MFNYGSIQTTKIPAPEIKLIAKATASKSKVFEVDAIIDTGASITCVPHELMKTLKIRVVDYVEVKSSVDGKIHHRETLNVHLRLAECEFEDFAVITL